MNKKGFTLLEMLSVLVLICILALLVFPSLINFIKKQQNIVENVNMSLIEESVDTLIEENQDNYISKHGNKYCVSISELVDRGYLNAKVSDKIENKRVQITYMNNKFKYELVDSDKCIIEPSICSLVSDESISDTGEREYIPGDEYTCNINDDINHTFYLLSSDKDKVSFIMESNINDNGDLLNNKDTVYENFGLITWVSLTDYNDNIGYGSLGNTSKGPITVINKLSALSSNWNKLGNVKPNYIINNSYNITYDLNTTTIKDVNKKVTASYKNLKARLPHYEELLSVGCNSSILSCPLFIYNYLSESEYKTDGTNIAVNCYWTDTKASDSEAYIINNNASLSKSYVNLECGIRPVIEVPKSMID